MNKYTKAWDVLMGKEKMNIDKWGESLDTIEELVEKATPKKVKKSNFIDLHTPFMWFECPICGLQVTNDNWMVTKCLTNYCKKCGQALDWSEEE